MNNPKRLVEQVKQSTVDALELVLTEARKTREQYRAQIETLDRTIHETEKSLENSGVLKNLELFSDPISFKRGTPDPVDEGNRLILLPKCRLQTITLCIYPPTPFILKQAEFTPDSDDLDFDMVQVGNTMCSPFAKRHPVCDVGMRIMILVSYRGESEIQTKVKLTGIGLDTSELVPQ